MKGGARFNSFIFRLAASATAGALAAFAAPVTIYGLTGDNQIVTFDSSNPGSLGSGFTSQVNGVKLGFGFNPVVVAFG